MNPTVRSRLPAALAGLSVGVLAAVLYLAFVFPRTMALWAEEGRRLSLAQQTIADLSRFCSAYGLLLCPLLFAGMVGFGVWAVVAACSAKPGTVIGGAPDPDVHPT